MSIIHRLFGSSQEATVLCPRCEHSLEGHDEAACSRKMSRRWFFGVCAGAAAATVIVPPVNPKIAALFAARERDILYGGGSVSVSRYLYRIPVEIFRGGNFRLYDSLTNSPIISELREYYAIPDKKKA